jgi:hypothetical protein
LEVLSRRVENESISRHGPAASQSEKRLDTFEMFLPGLKTRSRVHPSYLIDLVHMLGKQLHRIIINFSLA